MMIALGSIIWKDFCTGHIAFTRGNAAVSHGVLEVDGITKDFPGLRALDHVSLRLRSGTVHAVMGENGAGKSTLMRIIAGDLQPTSGQVRMRGRPCEFSGRGLPCCPGLR